MSEPCVTQQADDVYACLVAVSGEAIGRLFKLTQPRHVVGRGEGATIQLCDEGIVAHHAELRHENGCVVLAVLNQNAETYVNGSPIVQRTLLDGDRIQLGTSARLKYTTPAPLTRSSGRP